MGADVLVVEDDRALGLELVGVVAGEGHRVQWSRTLADARQQLAAGEWTLILVDLGLPDGDGIELCQLVREGGAPAVVLRAPRRPRRCWPWTAGPMTASAGSRASCSATPPSRRRQRSARAHCRRTGTTSRAHRTGPALAPDRDSAPGSCGQKPGAQAAGLLGGLGIGLLLAQELVKVLTGIFDPPPELIAVPWGFLTGTFAAVLLAAGVATALLERATSCVDASRLRG